MLDTQTAVFTIILSAIALSFILYGLWYLKVNILNPGGKGCEKQTERLLRRFALLKGFRVFSNVSFSYKSTEYRIENILIGRFGILIVSTLGGRGAYFGQLDGKTWQRMDDNIKEAFPNPAALQDDAIMALRSVFSLNKVYSVPMEGVVVITSRAKKTQLHITNDGRIFLPGKLKAYIRKSRFEKDSGVDPEKVAGIVSQISKS